MQQQHVEIEYADWLTDLTDENLDENALRKTLAERIYSAEEIEQSIKEIEIARRVNKLMLNLRNAEVELPVGFQDRLMAQVRNDETFLNLLEVYSTGFGATLIGLINALFSFIPTAAPEPNLAAR